MPKQVEDIRSERVAGYAAAALLLDLQYTASNAFQGLDMESISIVLCVIQNSLHDVINEPNVTALHIRTPTLPDTACRGMSRRAIADKLALSRETVRRRTKELLAIGLLDEDANRYVRITQTRFSHTGLSGLNQFHDCVLAYLKLLDTHKIELPIPSEELRPLLRKA